MMRWHNKSAPPSIPRSARLRWRKSALSPLGTSAPRMSGGRCVAMSPPSSARPGIWKSTQWLMRNVVWNLCLAKWIFFISKPNWIWFGKGRLIKFSCNAYNFGINYSFGDIFRKCLTIAQGTTDLKFDCFCLNSEQLHGQIQQATPCCDDQTITICRQTVTSLSSSFHLSCHWAIANVFLSPIFNINNNNFIKAIFISKSYISQVC